MLLWLPHSYNGKHKLFEVNTVQMKAKEARCAVCSVCTNHSDTFKGTIVVMMWKFHLYSFFFRASQGRNSYNQ